MKTIRIHQYGGPEVLSVVEVKRPTPGPDELLVRVQATSVNPIDWKIRAGYMKDFIPLSFPATLGFDISGTVEAAGSGVKRFKAGDDIYALLDDIGGYAEYVVIKEAVAASKPKTIDHLHAAAVPVAGLTAWQSLFEAGQLRAGQTVLIHGAAGGVGHLAVQFAKAKGARVIGTASLKNQSYLRQLGVDHPIDYEKTRFEDVSHDVDVVLDTIGGEIQDRSWKVLREGGILVSLVAPPSPEQPEQYGVRGSGFSAHSSSSDLAEIARLIDAGRVTPMVETILPLTEVRRAHEISESGHARGKIALKVA
jgi:NADPH:quinone reductase-like Zn-dependent oxidoreductase